MTKSILNHPVMTYTQTEAFVWRAVNIGIARDLNFAIVNNVRRALQAKASTTDISLIDYDADGRPFTRDRTIDDLNSEKADAEAKAEAERVREEQGHPVQMLPLEQAALMKGLRDAIARKLYEKARREPNPMDPHGGLLPRRWDCAPALTDEVNRQANRVPAVNMPQMEQLAMSLNLPVSDVVLVHKTSLERQHKWFVANRAEILATVEMLHAMSHAGHQYTDEEMEQIEERLPVVQRCRLFVAADSGLYFEINNQVRRAFSDNNARGNIVMLNAARISVQNAYNDFLQDPKIKAELQLSEQYFNQVAPPCREIERAQQATPVASDLERAQARIAEAMKNLKKTA